MIEIILYLLFSLVIFTLSWTTYNLYKKVDFLEHLLDKHYITTQQILTEMRNIDSTGHFESDDETGEVFQALVKSLNQLDKLTEVTK
jgi:ABC-type uncharacterized transport system permease subunit